jgi:hypothetical protein
VGHVRARPAAPLASWIGPMYQPFVNLWTVILRRGGVGLAPDLGHRATYVPVVADLAPPLPVTHGRRVPRGAPAIEDSRVPPPPFAPPIGRPRKSGDEHALSPDSSSPSMGSHANLRARRCRRTNGTTLEGG